MGRLVVSEFVSVDGVIADPGAPSDSSAAGGRFASTVAPRATGSSSRRCSPPPRCCWAALPTKASPPPGLRARMRWGSPRRRTRCPSTCSPTPSSGPRGATRRCSPARSPTRRGAEVTAGRGDPRQRERPARARPDRARPHRRVPADGVPGPAGRRQALFADGGPERPLRVLDSKPAGECVILIYERAGEGERHGPASASSD